MVATGEALSEEDKEAVSGWTDVAYIFANEQILAAVRTDGSVMAVGSWEYYYTNAKDWDLSSWNLLQ